MPKTICFYHSPCNDGGSAAAALRYRLAHLPEPRALELMPMGFGLSWEDPFNDTFLNRLDDFKEIVDEIYIVDISMSAGRHAQVIDKLRAAGRIGDTLPRTVCIDHHISAIDRLEEIESYCDDTMIEIGTGLSGATLVWLYCDQRLDAPQPMPLLLRYVADQDLWEWRLPRSREINGALNILAGEIDAMEREMLESIEDEKAWSDLRALQGASIVSMIDSLVRRSYGRLLDVVGADGVHYRIVNGTDSSSEIGNELCVQSDHNPHVVAIIYAVQEDWSVKCSIRSVTGSKVTARDVAERYGGGGHDNAAGCRFADIDAMRKALAEITGQEV